MGRYRSYLIQTLQHIIAGGDITGEHLNAGVPDYDKLDEGMERLAWSGLTYWAEDGERRLEYPDHPRMMISGAINHLQGLEELPD